MLNKIAKRELSKVTEVPIQFDDNTTKIIIKRRVDIKLAEGEYYLIKISDFMINPPANSVINSNWNQGNNPHYKYYKVEINKILNNMIKVSGVSDDYEHDGIQNEFWSGWIPREELTVIQKI